MDKENITQEIKPEPYFIVSFDTDAMQPRKNIRVAASQLKMFLDYANLYNISID